MSQRTPPTFFDPWGDGQDHRFDPAVAPGIWQHLGYADSIGSGVKRQTDVPPQYQANYDEGFAQGEWTRLICDRDTM